MSFFATIVKDAENLPAEIKALFTSPAAEAAAKEIAGLVVKAQPWVTDIQLFVGSIPVAAQVIAAYEKYAVPYAQDILTHTGAQLATDTEALAVAVMQKNGVKASTVQNIKTAVSIASAAVQANAGTATAS